MSSITNLISVGVNGTGTVNSVMKWLDADTATDSIIYDNGTNIGIGTSSPLSGLNPSTYRGIHISGTFPMMRGSDGATNYWDLIGDSSATYLSAVGVRNLILQTNGAERMRIDSAGNVGIGTSSPAAKIDISNEVNATAIGDSILTVRNTRVNTGSGAANIRFITNEVSTGTQDNRAQIGAEYDGANGGRLVFSTAQTSTKTITERMRITSAGSVLIGSTSTPYAARQFINTNISSENGLLIKTTVDSGSWGYVRFVNAGNFNIGGIFQSSSSTINYAISSDYRLKEDLQPVSNPLDKVNALKPVNFAWKSDGKRVDGFLAHEVAEVIPEAVIGEKDAIDKNGKPIYQGIDQSKLVPLLTAAIQELKAEIETLKSQING